MVSYFKTQWSNLLLGAINFGVSIVYFCVGDEPWGVAFMLLGVIWVVLSAIFYNNTRIELLEKKQEETNALVHKLLEANKLYSELELEQDERINRLEEKLR